MKFFFLPVLLGLLFASASLFGRETINLNRSWKFVAGWEVRSNIYSEINLPHTWNRDALSGKQDYFRGLCNYEKTLDIPAEWKGKQLYLRFKGVNTIANVFINGKHTMEHRGGYTAFTVDITNRVKYGEKNVIMVRVNNALQLDIMPLLGDFNMYGGIYRDVDLIVTEPEHVSPMDFGSNGVYLKQSSVTKDAAKVDAKIMVNGTVGTNPLVAVKILDDKQNVVAQQEVTTVLDAQGKGVALLTLDVKKPHLWNGVKDPYRYDVEVSVKKDGKETDKVMDKIGFRYFHVDPDKGFFLNGEHLQLRGVCRHQDRAEIGNALSPVHHDDDMAIMLEMGVNAIRLAHYPQDKYFYDLCDKNGLVVWAEIPFIGPGGYRDKGFVDQASFRDNGKQQLIELVRQNFNHPSICFWGIFNELKQVGDDPCDYILELNELAHQEDPTRITTAASNQGGRLNELTDVIAWNQYFGWYGGDPSSIGKWADATHKKYPTRGIAVSEYGAGASIAHQQEKLEKTVAGSYWHPENWQTYFHEEHWKAMDQRPFLWGTFVWNMFDFGAAHRTEGEIPGKNDKGLVTFDRKFKKDAFYFYKANWNRNEPFVYIAERRITQRKQAEQVVKIYSNCDEVELFVNGKSMGKRKGEYGIFKWEKIGLKKGENVFSAQAKPKLSDEVVVYHE